MRMKIYLDNAASTPLDPDALEAMLPFYREQFGNASGVHDFSRVLANKVEGIRSDLAGWLGVRPSELLFTASATEANNTVLKTMAANPDFQNSHVLISAIEHPSVSRTAEWLQQFGINVEKIPVLSNGIVDPNSLEKRIRPETKLVSIMQVNNETGAIQPVTDIGRICRERNILFHCDAAQAFGKLPFDYPTLKVDYLTISSHKLYGPLGCGVLYHRQGVPLIPLLHGGGQENGRRASTLNVPAIAGFGAAVRKAMVQPEHDHQHLTELRTRLIEGILANIPDVQINGDLENCFPGILNLSFRNTDAEILSMQLNRHGIAVSTGSACSSGALKDSPVLTAMGIGREWLKGTIRFSPGRFNTKDEIEQVLQALPGVIAKVRKLS